MALQSWSALVVAGGQVRQLFENFVLQLSSLGSAPTLHVHCLDDALHALCARLSGQHDLNCVRAPCCNASQGYHGNVMEAVLTYKFQAATRLLSTTSEPVVLLDLDALVTRRGCFDEWLAAPEAIVMQIGGAPGCPTRAYTALGFGPNTGAMLLRPEATAFLHSMLRQRESGFRYRNHCYEQELFAMAVVGARPRWRHFPTVLALDGAPVTGADPLGEPLALRLLNYSRWSGGDRTIRISTGQLRHEVSQDRNIYDRSISTGHQGGNGSAQRDGGTRAAPTKVTLFRPLPARSEEIDR